MLPKGFTTVQELKDSNIEILARFNSLAWYAVRRYQKTYHFSEDQTEELYRRLLVYLFAAPLSYRNQRGISKIIGTKLAGLRHAILDLECEVEQPSDHADVAQAFDDSIRQSNMDYLCSDSRLHLAMVLRHLHVLTSSELAVIKLIYGFTEARTFNVNMVCRKLGRPRHWVTRRVESAVLKLQRALRLPETISGLKNDLTKRNGNGSITSEGPRLTGQTRHASN